MSLSTPTRRTFTALVVAQDRFEPFVAHAASPNVLDQLLAGGLVEAGPSCRPAVGPVGHRFTSKGRALAEKLRAERARRTTLSAE